MEISTQGVLIQLAIFIATLALFKGLIFKPLLDRRERQLAATEQQEARARQLAQEAQQLASRYERESLATYQQADQRKNQAREAAQQEGRKLIEQARGEASQMIEKTQTALKQNRSELEKQLAPQVKQLSDAFIEQVLS